MKRKYNKKSKIIWLLLLLGFCAMEFPGVFFFGGRAYPFVFGIPFVYAYMLFWWFFMCAVMFYAYRNNWGRERGK